MLYKPQLQMQTSPCFSTRLGSKFWAGKADSEPRWTCSAAASAKHSVQIPNEERPDGSRLRAPPCAAPRGKSIVKPCAKPAPQTLPGISPEQPQPPHQRGWGTPLDLQGHKIPSDTGWSLCTFYAAWVMTLVWSNPSPSPEG